MTVDQFIARLEAENVAKKGTHKLGKPTDAAAIAKWEKKNPQFAPLPAAFAELLKRANGLTLVCDEYAVEDVGGRLRILGLPKLQWAGTVMYGDDADDYEIPPHWLGLGWDDNKDYTPILDTKTGEICISDKHAGPGESDEVLDSVEDFLAWLVDHVLDPHQEDLRQEAESKKKAKSGGKKKPAPDLEEVHIFREAKGRLLDLAVSADGRRAVTAGNGPEWSDKDQSEERTLRLWDLAERKQERVFEGHRKQISQETKNPDGTFSYRDCLKDHGVTACAISPDGRRVLAGFDDDDRLVKLFDADTGKALKTISDRNLKGITRFSADGRYVFLACGNYVNEGCAVCLLDATTFETVAQWEAHQPRTANAVFTPDSRRVITSGSNKTLKIWAVPSAKPVGELPRQRSPIVGLAISPDGRRLTLGSWGDPTVRVIDLASQQVVAELPGHKAPMKALSFSPDGGRLATMDGDSIVRVWDVAAGAEVARYGTRDKEHWSGNMPGTGIQFLPDGRHLVTCSCDRTLRLLRLPV